MKLLCFEKKIKEILKNCDWMEIIFGMTSSTRHIAGDQRLFRDENKAIFVMSIVFIFFRSSYFEYDDRIVSIS